MSEISVVPRAATARESNAAAARRGLWDALDTMQCGRPEIVRGFLELLSPDRRIVDIGCWHGAIAALAAASIGGGSSHGDNGTRAPWSSYAGVDVVPEAVTEFRRVHGSRPRTGAVEGDVRALPLADDSADVVLCLFVLQDLEGHRADGIRALGELARIARRGAELLIGLTVHSTREEETFYVVKKLRREGIPEKPTHHWRRTDFLDALRESGWRITRIDEFGPNEGGFVELYVRAVTADRGSGTRPGMSTGTVPMRLLPGAPKLSVDYISDFDLVSDFFAHDFRDDNAFARAGRVAAARELPRDAVADVLLAQNRIFGGGQRTMQNVDRLRDRESVVVVTGQQPALFGGPLYNLYKAATTVRLSQHLEEQTGRAHVPVFWIANDDHELARVDHIHALDGDSRLARIAWHHEIPRSVQPIAAVRLDEAVAGALDRLAEIADGSRHGEDVLDLLAGSFRAGERLSDSFARLLSKLFESEGLVLVDPSDPRLRRLGMPRLAAELSFPSPATEAARAATKELAARGYPAQVALRDDRLNMFFGRAERFRLRCGSSGFQIGHRSERIDAAGLRSSFHAALEQFSPNVLLRPLYQDALFPTVAYVAGPSEIAYFAQLKPVYSRFEMPMPVIYPRTSITLVNARARSLLAGSGLRIEDVWGATLDPRLSSYLLPGGLPQERMLGIAHGLLDHGLELVSSVLSTVSFSVFDHQVVFVDDDAAAPVGRTTAGG